MTYTKRISWIIILLHCHYVISQRLNATEKDDLTAAEAKDGQLEIIKTIKKINDDGSYTIGYEADDGSFKIESRDVLGNIKGTYGYLDEVGDIKRISYTTNNLTNAFVETPTVVQRIPKSNKTHSNGASILLYNPSTPTSPSAIEENARNHYSSSTTQPSITAKRTSKPNYGDYVRTTENGSKSTTSAPSNVVYATSAPSTLIYTPRSLIRSNVQNQKSEGQILRPEVISKRPTDVPIRRTVPIKQSLLESDSIVIQPEAQKLRSNLLRRQLNPENPIAFDPRKHIANLNQGVGEDSNDVYSSSISTATPRPLFTTTGRSRISSTIKPVVEHPTPIYIDRSYNRVANFIPTTGYVQETTTTEATISASSMPALIQHNERVNQQQIQQQQQPLVQARHPFHGGVVLVPYNQASMQENQPQYYVGSDQYYKPTSSTPNPIQHQEISSSSDPIYIQRPQVLRSIPVHLDENGYVRPVRQRQVVNPTSYPLFIPAPVQKDNPNEIESIKPPVSTQDFQKLIEYLITRQTRLEKANALINSERQRELMSLRPHRSYSTPEPLIMRRPQELSKNGPVTFLSQQLIPRQNGYSTEPQMQLAQPAYYVRQPINENDDMYEQQAETYVPSSYQPSKRVARLLPSNPAPEEQQNQNYLPTQIREMLLLRMLQLAINPALPLELNDNAVEDSTPAEQTIKKTGIRNVQIIGET